jgi:hypothetical protein
MTGQAWCILGALVAGAGMHAAHGWPLVIIAGAIIWALSREGSL